MNTFSILVITIACIMGTLDLKELVLLASLQTTSTGGITVLMSQRLFSSLAGLVKALVDLVAMDLKATTPTSFLELQLGAILLLPSLLHSALPWVMAYSDPSSLRQ